MKIADWFRNVLIGRATGLRAVTPLSTPVVPAPPVDPQIRDRTPVWSVVANVLIERPYGPGGIEKRAGTKHFAPGAKVYVIAFHWGPGALSVTVIGKHRKSHRFICIDMQSKALCNWRAERVYSPYVIRHIWERGELASVWVAAEGRRVKDPTSEYARARAVEIAEVFINRGAGTQPFVTRPKSG